MWNEIRFNDIKTKLELFFKQISEASDIWPKRRIFYEKSIDLIADTQILSTGSKKMLKLMKKYDIENELTDYVYERDVVNTVNSMASKFAIFRPRSLYPRVSVISQTSQ